MNDSHLAAVIEDCLRALRGGASREECLGAYPELRAQLEPILVSAGALAAMPRAGLTPAASDRVRSGLIEAIGREPRAVRRRPGLWSPRLALVPALAAAIAAIMVLVSLSPFSDSNVARADTVLSVLQGTVLVETESGLVEGRDGMLLRPNDRVITREGARAVLTFFDGSTVTLEANTSLLINQVTERDGQLSALLTQDSGQTWTHIPSILGLAEMRINTPNALVATDDGTFETTVSDGQTRVTTGAGDVRVESGDNQTSVPGGSESAVRTPGVVAEPSLASPPETELVVVIRGAAFAHVTDPSGSTVGVLAPGVPVNQITGASVHREGDLLIIRIPNPDQGGYVLGVAAAERGGASVSARLRDDTVTRLAEFDLAADESWTVRFRVDGEQVRPVGSERDKEPPPPPAIITDTAADKALEADEAKAGTPQPRPQPTSTSTPKPEPTKPTEPEPTATPAVRATPIADQLEPQDTN